MRILFSRSRLGARWFGVVLVGWLGLLSRTTDAQSIVTVEPEDVGLSGQQLQAVPEAVGQLVANRKGAGAVVLVARHGKVAFLDAQGFRDVASESPMQTDTLFRIYSMTKPVTSVAVLMLMEQGKLDLDDPIGQYLPELDHLEVH